MSYYQGDYYSGDYYTGDPGFLGFLGRVAKGALGVGAGLIPGGGALTRIAGKVIPHGGGTLAARAGGIVRAGRGVIVRHPVLSAAAAAGTIGAAGAVTGRVMRPGARALPPGFRRHRRMRVTNPKALRRAIRRTQGFAKLAMRTIHLVHPKKKVRFGGFRKRRARRGA